MDKDFNNLISQAQTIYHENFNGDAWLGRCIFLSFHCQRGTCDFCFRSLAKTSSPNKAMRSLASILSEALLIRAFDWRIEFLTGGYGIADQAYITRVCKLVSQVLGQRIWLNLGVLSNRELETLQPHLAGIVASLETLHPTLHNKVCPDKPIEPYLPMLAHAKELGLQRSITLVIGLGEDQSHWPITESFIKEYSLDRITLYALRPVKGTPYTKGPSSEELAWWIAKVRIAFPTIEIIAGTAEYRLDEVPLLLQAGANAITKLPATKLFNTKKAQQLENSINCLNRNWTSKLIHPQPFQACHFQAIIDTLELTSSEKVHLHNTLNRYLSMMSQSFVLEIVE